MKSLSEKLKQAGDESFETCGFCHTDGWEAMDCWASENDPDYDPFDI